MNEFWKIKKSNFLENGSADVGEGRGSTKYVLKKFKNPFRL